MKKFDLIIIGGCASGMVAAINAARSKPSMKIAVIEKLPKIGKKILATGNGKCNLTNLEATSEDYHNSDFVKVVFERYPVEKTLEFFSSLGLLTYSDACARVYPESNVASSVLDALRFEIKRLGINVICDTPVTEIKHKNNEFFVNSEFFAPKIILAVGGKSSPSQGSDGSGYALAKSLGHSVTPLYPALAPLAVEDEITRSLKGVRVRDTKLTLFSDHPIKETRGEVLFADKGLSGIASMELCAEAERYISTVKKYPFTVIDFLPNMTENEIAEYLIKIKNINGFCTLDNLLTGALPKAVGIAICKACNLYKSEKTIDSLNLNEIKAIAKATKNFRLKVTGSRGFSASQVTRGGVNVKEIDPKTMASKICRGLYFAGEITDVDAGCGGYNLQWAWASGLLAGENAAK